MQKCNISLCTHNMTLDYMKTDISKNETAHSMEYIIAL